jgi:RHS repeat-associated protein
MTKEAPESPSAVTAYVYDAASNVTSVEASDEPRAVTYSYDQLNLVSSVTDQEARKTEFTYNKRGLRRKTAYPNGVVQEARYDDARRLKCIYSYKGTAPAGTDEEACPSASTSLVTFFSYDYSDTVGGVQSDTNRREKLTERDSSTTTYDYDAISRLTAATTTKSSTTTRKHAYTYDALGNPTKEVLSGSTVTNATRTQAYADSGELCWSASGSHTPSCASPPSGATTYSYDAAGNLASASTGLAAAYSLRGHMVEVTPPGGTMIEMAYTDATQDRRILSGDTRMAYNQLGLSSQGPTSGTSKATWFPRDPEGTLVAMLNANSSEPDLYYLFDGLGSVAATTDASGNLVRRYAYEPYGEEIGRSATDANPWRYASGYYDQATGMLKFGTRYYMPDLLRWTQRDPVMGKPNDPMTLNAYGYVGGDPCNSTDPTGRFVGDMPDYGCQPVDTINDTVGNIAFAGAGINWVLYAFEKGSPAAGFAMWSTTALTRTMSFACHELGSETFWDIAPYSSFSA